MTEFSWAKAAGQNVISGMMRRNVKSRTGVLMAKVGSTLNGTSTKREFFEDLNECY